MRNSAIDVFEMQSGLIHKQINGPDQRNTLIEIPRFLDVLYPVTSMRWIPDISGEVGYDTLLAGYADSALKFWNVGKQHKDYEIDEEGNLGIYSVDYSVVGDKIATGGADRSVRIYCNNSKKLITEMKGLVNNELVHHFNRIHCVKFGEDEHTVISGGTDMIVTVHDTRDCKSVAKINGPYILGEAIDVNGNELLTGSYRSKD
jgi:WD40 repeat protein